MKFKLQLVVTEKGCPLKNIELITIDKITERIEDIGLTLLERKTHPKKCTIKCCS